MWDRRIKADVLFIFKLVNGTIDCPNLLKRLNFFVPVVKLRTQPIFNISYCDLFYDNLSYMLITKVLSKNNGM